jgi:hypothetical protein
MRAAAVAPSFAEMREGRQRDEVGRERRDMEWGPTRGGSKRFLTACGVSVSNRRREKFNEVHADLIAAVGDQSRQGRR